MLVDGEKLRPMIEAIPSLLTVAPCAELKQFAERIKDRQLACLRDCEVNIQPPSRIEAAISFLRKEYVKDREDCWNDWELANALAWAFGLPQEENKRSAVSTIWKNKDFGL